MAVRIGVDGRALLNATTYSVQEDSTPISPADESGGTAQIDFTIPAFPGWKSSEDALVDVRDDTQGVTQGIVETISENSGLVQISAKSRILNLSATRIAQPFRGSLSNAIRYYLSLVGIIDGIVIDEQYDAIQVIFPGWQDDVYQRIARGLCPAYSMEMSLVSNNIVFRPPRQRKAILTRVSTQGIQESIDAGSRAQRSKLNWYKTAWIDTKLVYPAGGWTSDVEVFDVNAGEVKVIENLEISSSLVSVQQPLCVLNVGPEDGTASAYTVAGNDGLPIPPDMWRAYGGDLRVEINPDTRSLKVTIRGMDFAEYAPYSIAVSSGDGTSYSTLRIFGTGVTLDPQVVDMGTGLTQDQAPTEYGDEVDNEFLNDRARAYLGAEWQSAGVTGPARTISFTASGINRASDTGSARFATFADWDAEFAGMNTDDWDAIWASRSEEDWEEFWTEQVASDFTSQAFGNVAGARVIHSDSFFRIRTVTNQQGSIQATAEADNTVDDFDTYYAGMTTDDWDALWEGGLVKEFDVAPFPDMLFDGTRPVW